MNIIEFNNEKCQLTTWAIVAGTVVALAAEVVLNFLGMGLNLSIMMTNTKDMSEIGIGLTTWLVISGVIAMALGGWVSGKISNSPYKLTRAIHGLVSWSFATLFAISVSATAVGAATDSIFSSAGVNSSNNVTIEHKNSGVTGRHDSRNESNLSATDLRKDHDSDEKEISKNDLANFSMAMFIGFLLSLIASIMGAVYANNRMDNNIK